MNLSAKKQEEILKRNTELESLKPTLKSEFIGIDNIIDQVIDSMRPFYIFPEALKRPLIVNLWGMTGTGKTSLVNRIVELLNLKHKYLKFDIGEYSSTTGDWKLRTDLSDKVKKVSDKHLIVAFDEFQFGRTISEGGNEVDRSSLRPMWDIIDSGIICQMSKSNFACSDIASKYRKCLESGVVVEDGVVVEGEEIYMQVFKDEHIRYVDFVVRPELSSERNQALLTKWREQKALKKKGITIPIKDDVEYMDNAPEEDDDEIGAIRIGPPVKPKRKKSTFDPSRYPVYSEEEMFQSGLELYYRYHPYATTKQHVGKPYFVKYAHYLHMFEANPSHFMELNDYPRWKETFRMGQTGDEIVNLLYKEFVAYTPLMTKEDYSQSLVFCVGNIDEAYAMSHSSNPDADADAFYEHSLKITVPKMKSALSCRFRMEQIGRLGNNHIIYPSFNRATYEHIIRLNTDQRVDYFDKEFGIKLVLGSSVNEILYKESVFPSQGARPILSTINMLLDSYVAQLMADIILNNKEAHTVEWEFVDGKESEYIVKAISDTLTTEFRYPVKLNIEQLRKADLSELQAQVGVHEAGHAVLAIMKAKLLPTEVKSRTASNAEGYVSIQMPDVNTKMSLYTDILISLGGLEAERLVFGDAYITNGATSDLARATTTATAMVKTYGMSGHLHQVKMPDMFSGSNVIFNDESHKIAEAKAMETVAQAQIETRQCLEDNFMFLMELANYLSVHPNISEDALKRMAKKYTNEFKDKDNYYNYREMVKDKFKEAKAKKSEERAAIKIGKPVGLPGLSVFVSEPPEK